MTNNSPDQAVIAMSTADIKKLEDILASGHSLFRAYD